MTQLLKKFIVLAVASVGFASISIADDAGQKGRKEFDVNALTSKWRISAGGALSSYETRAAWSAKGLVGAVIILEDTLGLDEEVKNFSLKASFRFNRRNSIELAATDLSRTAHRLIDAEIEWGDYVYRAFGQIATKFDMRVIRLKWKYDFSDSGRLNAGISAGLSTLDLGIALEGEARLEDDESNEWVKGAVSSAHVIAPVPVIGFYLDYALSPRWVLRLNTEAIDLDLGQHSGRVLHTEFSFEYLFSDLFGIAVGVSGMDLNYHGEKRGERFGVDFSVKSANASLSFSF